METSNLSHTVVKVTLAQRGLEAWASVHPPQPLPVEEIRLALRQHNVIEGLDEEAINHLAEFPPDDDVLVARGTQPVNGDPARIEYFFYADTPDFKPVVDDNDRVDYREGKLIQNVVPGQLLARKVPATLGQAGRTVTGESIPASPGKDMHLLAGKNVELSANKLEAFASVYGIPRVAKNRLSVLPVFQVNDVDFSVGNINFQGSVLIRGTVHPGFTVRATDDISVEGNVEGGLLEAGGTIRVKGGVRSNAILKAAQDIHIRFCDSGSTLEAGREIKVTGDALHSTLIARHRIVVDNHLIGGNARAGALIQALIVGTPAETPTRVELVQDGAKEEIDKLKEEIASLEADVQEVTGLIQSLMGKPQEDGPVSIQKLTPMKVNMNIRLTQLKIQLKELLESQENLDSPRLVVKSELFGGVIVRFSTPQGSKTQRILSKQFATSLNFVDGDIQN